MKKYNRLAVALLDLRTDPPLSLIVVFMCGVMILAVLGNYLYSWVTADDTSPIAYTPRLLSFILGLLVIAFVAYLRYEQTLRERTTAVEQSQFLPVKYLISGLSPFSINPSTGSDNLENVRRLLLHNKDVIQTLYLVSILDKKDDIIVTYNTRYTAESSKKVKEAYDKLQDWIDQNLDPLPQIVLVPLKDANSAEFSFQVVSEILISLRSKGISTSEVLIDVTPGTKAMTVGLATAALVNGFPISYQASMRDADGNPSVDSPETTLVALNLQNHLRLPD